MRLPTCLDARVPSGASRASAGRTAVVLAVAAAVLVIHDQLIRDGVSEVGTLATNGAFVGALLGVAHWAGMRRADVGLVTGRHGVARTTARVSVARGLVAIGIVIAIALTIVALTAVRGCGVPLDGCMPALSLEAIVFRAFVGIPIGTALCEEVIFRGVILSATDRLLAKRWSTVATSAAFGLWHVAAELHRVGGGSVLGVVPGVLATTAASAFVLCPLRRRSEGLRVPIAVHAGTNVAVFLAVTATRLVG